MRLRYAFVLASLAAGCVRGPNFKREVISTGGAAVQPRGADGSAPATTIQLGRGNYDIALAFNVPRAQVIEFELACEGQAVRRGQAGETFEAYRVRRLALRTSPSQRLRRRRIWRPVEPPHSRSCRDGYAQACGPARRAGRRWRS